MGEIHEQRKENMKKEKINYFDYIQLYVSEQTKPEQLKFEGKLSPRMGKGKALQHQCLW